MKSALILGGTGFIGSNMVKELLENNYDVTLGVRNPLKVKNNDVNVVPYNMKDTYSLKKYVNDADYVFNFVWDGTSGNSRFDLDLQLSNIRYTKDILKFSKNINARYVESSSLMENEAILATLNNELKPHTGYIYSNAKYMAHAVTKIISNEESIDAVWGKITNAYGPGEISARLISSTIDKLIHNKIPEFTTATQMYDFIFIKDLVRAFRIIAEKGKSGTEYVIGSGNPQPLKKFLEIMNNTIAPDVEFKYGGVPNNGMSLPKSNFDINDLKSIGFVPKYSFEDGIKLTYEWFLKNTHHDF